MKRRRFKTNTVLLLRHPLLFARTYWLALAILLVGTVADGVTTYANVRDFGAVSEIHPAGRLMMHWFGAVWGTVLGKVGQAAAAVLVGSLWRRWCGALMILAGLLYALAAVINHFRLL